MGYLHIQNLYKQQTILLFRECYAMEKIHGTSAHVGWKFATKSVHLSSGGESIDKFSALFNTEALSNKFIEIFPDIDVTIYGEAYGGCLCCRTPILLTDGSKMEIGKIVNNKLNIDVLSYNFLTEKLESKKVINWYRTENKNNWKTVYFERRFRGGKSTKLIVTDNHVFYVDFNGTTIEKSCKDLNVGDEVFIPHEKISYVQEDVIRGGLLGDGSMSHSNKTRSYIFKFSHSLKQKDYADFKGKILNSIINIVKNTTSGFGSECIRYDTKSLPDLRNIYSELYSIENKKSITTNYLNKLSPLSMAIWYMDDGSLKINKIGSHRNTSILSTQGFSENENDIIVNWFNEKGLFCRKEVSGKYFIVKFTPDGTEKFQQIIAPYIIPEMRYKLNDEFKEIPFVLNDGIIKQSNMNLVKTKILKIENGNPYHRPSYNERFDIEVEDNHNFFANNILVHNSQQGQSHVYGKVLKFIGFDVHVGDVWLNVPNAEDVCKQFNIEFVHYEKIPANLENFNNERDQYSVQAIRNGMGTGLKREGIVLRPLVEMRTNNGERVICKYKPDEQMETKTKREVTPEQVKVLADAKAIS
jgi:intein/homing endonuclease